MEWLNRKSDFLAKDIELLEFSEEEKSCAIRTIQIQESHELPSIKDHVTGHSFLGWLELQSSRTMQLQQQGITVVMHSRLDELDSITQEPLGAMALPYTAESFIKVTRCLFQHRSLSDILNRASTAVINSRRVAWSAESCGPFVGPSIVYNCRSDTESPSNPNKPDDIAISATTFPSQRTIYAVIYGCTPSITRQVSGWLKSFMGQAPHPLIMPLIFAELERKRLFNMLDLKQNSLKTRILDLEIKLRGESQSTSLEGGSEPLLRSRDCESTKLWIDVSLLRNGIQSLKAQLVKLTAESRELAATVFEPQPHTSSEKDIFSDERMTGVRIESRLHAMIEELDSKVQSCDSLLGGMALAAQMESNYYTRRDAKVAIIIANLTKKDGSQMRSISLLGMIFLPGTFLASLFSMSFFNWSPPDSNQILSPWIALYGVLAIAITLLTVWRMRKWMEEQDLEAREQLKKEVNSDDDSMV